MRGWRAGDENGEIIRRCHLRIYAHARMKCAGAYYAAIKRGDALLCHAKHCKLKLPQNFVIARKSFANIYMYFGDSILERSANRVVAVQIELNKSM